MKQSSFVILLSFLLGACGNTCRVGQELGPGESCDVPGAGTFSVRADGCAGELPVSDGDDVSMGNMRLSVSTRTDGTRESTTCIAGYVEVGGFRASEVSTPPEVHDQDAIPGPSEPDSGDSDTRDPFGREFEQRLESLFSDMDPDQLELASWRIDAIP